MVAPRLLLLIAGSTPMLVALALLEAILITIMSRKCESLKETYGRGIDIPDTWFGITPPHKLYDYLEALGPEGRTAYKEINALDLFPYIPCYAIFFGALLGRLCQSTGQSTNISWIFPIIMFFDIIESSIIGYATRQYPEHLGTLILMIASIANQMKWLGIYLGLVALVALATLFIRKSLFDTKRQHQS